MEKWKQPWKRRWTHYETHGKTMETMDEHTHTHTWEYIQKMETHDEQHMVILMNTSQRTLHTWTFQKKRL